MPVSEDHGHVHDEINDTEKTPTRLRNSSGAINRNLSPSPLKSRRGIVHTPGKAQDYNSIRNRNVASGRSGSRSPNKRTIKRENEIIDDDLSDLEEAERIINESRNEQQDPQEAFVADIPREYEEIEDGDDMQQIIPKDILEGLDDESIKQESDEHADKSIDPDPPRRPRRAAARALAATKYFSALDEEHDSSDEAQIESEGSEVSEVSEVSEAGESSVDEASAEELSGDDSSYGEKSSKKQTRQYNRKLPSKRKHEEEDTSDSELADVELSTKRRVGRPSKNSMPGKIKSIFELDDEMLGVTKSPTKTPQAIASPLSAKANTDIWAEFDKLQDIEQKSALIISGIEEANDDKKLDARKFIPFPEPKLDKNGKLDAEYVKKHLPNVDFEARAADLMDDRAFFMEGTEGYFEQHSMRPKLGRSSLALLAPSLEYSDFIVYNQLPQLIKKRAIASLEKMHKALYHQWCFELSEGYSINFYGYGSKRQLIVDFVQDFLLEWIAGHYNTEESQEVGAIIVNGYNPNTQFKQVVYEIQSLLVPKDVQKKLKFSKHIFETIPLMVKHLASVRSNDSYRPRVVLAIHNVDGPAFLDEKTQNLLSQLASLPEVWLLTSTDNINASLLWDLFKLKNFNFVWHDLTTYQPYSAELSFKDILNTGKSTKFVGTRGAKYVLSSLTSNARELYRTLLQLQIDNLNNNAASEAAKANLKGNLKLAVGFKQLYDSCSQQFITSNEISFRTMLGEFVEHKMCNLKKNSSGGEVVFVPFSYDEIKKLLQDEFSN